MDVLFFNETPHVHPAARTQTCQGSSCVLFTVSSLETQKNKPQTDWPHFPPSEQRKKNAPFLMPGQMAEAKQRIQYVIIRMNKFLMGKAWTSGAHHTLISIGVQSCLPGTDRPQFYFGEKVCVMIWQGEFGFEPIIGKMNPPWESSWMFSFPPCSSCNHSVQRMFILTRAKRLSPASVMVLFHKWTAQSSIK